MATARSRAGDTVNGLLYRATGRADDDAEEALWALNPNLLDYGPVLPVGVVVTLPDLADDDDDNTVEVVTVWD